MNKEIGKNISLLIFFFAGAASAGPETALREFAGGQVKKGVRTIGMGGDGATTGNYALVYKDAGGAIFDEGLVHFLDTGNFFTFSAVGFTTPTFWDDAAFYVIALGQQGTGERIWTTTPPNPNNPASIGNLSDTSVFVKFAKPLSKTWSLGFMGAYEVSQATLVPMDGIDSAWKWTLPDAGVVVLDRSNDNDGTSSVVRTRRSASSRRSFKNACGRASGSSTTRDSSRSHTSESVHRGRRRRRVVLDARREIEQQELERLLLGRERRVAAVVRECSAG